MASVTLGDQFAKHASGAKRALGAAVCLLGTVGTELTDLARFLAISVRLGSLSGSGCAKAAAFTLQGTSTRLELASRAVVARV